MKIYQVTYSTINECYEGMDGGGSFTFESPSSKEAHTIVDYLNDEDGNSWSCEHSYYILDGVVDQPLEEHSTWDEISQYNTIY